MDTDTIKKQLKASKLPTAKIDWGVGFVCAVTEDMKRRLIQELPALVKAAEKTAGKERDVEKYFRFGFNVKGSVDDLSTVKAETKLGYSERTTNKGAVIVDTNQLLLQLEEGEPISLQGAVAAKEEDAA